MLRRILTTSAAVVFLSVGLAAADVVKPADASNSTVAGVVSVVGDNSVTVTDANGKEQKVTVGKDAVVTCDGKDCKLADLKKGATVIVTVKKDGDNSVASKIEARSAATSSGDLTFSDKVDAANDSQLWTMQKEGDYVLLISKSAKAALDVNNEKGNLYLNEKVDPKNNNQLWMLKPEGDFSMIVPKVGKGILDKGALDADNAKGSPYVNGKTDKNNDNELWTLEKHGDYYAILPKGHKAALEASTARLASSGTTVQGTIASVSAADNSITLTDAGNKEQTLTVAKDAVVTCDGKDCKLADLKKGATVTVTTKKEGDNTVATKIDGKSAK